MVLAEYAVARDEIAKRSDAQHLIENLTITAAGTIIGVIIANQADSSLLLLVPFVTSVFGMIWIDHAQVISRIGTHIRDHLAPLAVEISGEPRVMRWESVRLPQKYGAFYYVARFGPRFLIFEGIGGISLVASASVLIRPEHWWRGLWALDVAFVLLTSIAWFRLLTGSGIDQVRT